MARKKKIVKDTTVQLIMKNSFNLTLTKFFMEKAINADAYLTEKYKEIWTGEGIAKRTNVQTKCMRFKWAKLTDEQKGIIKGCLLVIGSEGYVYQDFGLNETFGDLIESQHRLSD